MAIIRMEVSYDDCYKGIDSDFVYKMMYWNKDKKTIGNKIKFKISPYDHRIAEELSGLFRIGIYSFTQAAIGIGLCGLGSIYKELELYHKQLKSLRFESDEIIKEIKEYMDKIITSGHQKELAVLIKKYDCNSYLAPLIFEFKITLDKQKKDKIPEGLLRHIRRYSLDKLTSNMFDKKNKGDDLNLVEIRIPDRTKAASGMLRGKVFNYDYPRSKIYECSMILGMHIICKKIIEDEKMIGCEERELSEFLSELIYLYTNLVPVSNNMDARIENFSKNYL